VNKPTGLSLSITVDFYEVLEKRTWSIVINSPFPDGNKHKLTGTMVTMRIPSV